MYRRVLVAVDNSRWSDQALNWSLALARQCGAELAGVHVYAGKLHDERFRQMEPSLPERYQSEEVLSRQREIHDTLIGRGLALISDSYLDVVEQRAAAAGVACERLALEGRNYEEILLAARRQGADLIALGAHGLGHGPRGLVGSVCERVARAAGVDVFVARQAAPLDGAHLAVAVDGSGSARAAARRAIALAKAGGGRLTALAVYDPFFHRVAFGSIAGVLSAEAAKVFRFREQEVLHDEIIDGGLMSLYQTHLDEVAAMATREGVPVVTKVLQGKPYAALLDWVEEAGPALLAVGHYGSHQGEAAAIGSNAENLLRLANCDLLLVSERADDKLSAAAPTPRAQSTVAPLEWTPEAQAGLARVPGFARNMARLAIEKYARAQGHRVVTPTVVDEARKGFGF
ncbi:MAG: universal stress protein [Chloroflexota bacterium]